MPHILRYVIHAMLILVASSMAGCMTAAATVIPPPPPPPSPPGTAILQVMFVGNSLTFANNLPGMVTAIARAGGVDIAATSAVGSNLALIDHVHGATNALPMLDAHRWDFVILQQGPTPSGICRDTLVLASQAFAPRIRAAGGVLAMLMPWNGTTQQGWADEVRVSFWEAARLGDGILIPVGAAWRGALEQSPGLALYAGDGYHPSYLGTALTALVTYERITGKDARDLAPALFGPASALPVPADAFAQLVTAAHRANDMFSARPATPAVPAEEEHPWSGGC